MKSASDVPEAACFAIPFSNHVLHATDEFCFLPEENLEQPFFPGESLQSIVFGVFLIVIRARKIRKQQGCGPKDARSFGDPDR